MNSQVNANTASVVYRCPSISEKSATRVIAILCLLVFACTAWLSLGFQAPLNPVDVGPGKVPLLASCLGMVCSIVLFAEARRLDSDVQLHRPAAVASGVLVMTAYVLLIPIAGFYLVSVFAVPLLMVVGGERRWSRLILCAAGFVIFIYLCFEQLLGVQFP
ncbi:hypothetical protein W822_07745 [Advenella kashmirensis W13003]|uniref:DUF1468 domain-containing protein n=1 Tax=Advenella kashmirensis W13003 TaxID=1424334 RepID=V8QU37_9BURK|nr:tripartite tricarboxylate transporter TctB family protein [Advenella kashmirensis]ETF03461.1 hypothetical protein W822_07745 [Advenella kashmirensis W13003]